MQQQPFIVPYVQPSVLKRPYRGVQIPKKRRVMVFRGGQPVRSREQVLAMVGRKV